jgi:hypothetical protein
MNALLSKVLEAHGGLDRWNQFSTARAQIVTGGGLWALKGLIQDSAPRQMTVSLREQVASVTPFGRPDWHTSFRPERVAIETLDGQVVREQADPRASFDGRTMNAVRGQVRRGPGHQDAHQAACLCSRARPEAGARPAHGGHRLG